VSKLTGRYTALGALAICATAGAVSVAFGPDNYWDLRFYHLYAPYAYLHGRYLYDVAPAEYQSFFNPIADFLFYGMASSALNAWPRTIAFIMGAVHGFNAVVVAAICRHVIRCPDGWARVVLVSAAAVIGISGAGFVPLIGTTSNDLISSIFVLGALFGVLRIADASSGGGDWQRFAWPGLSAGIALGLKYTAAVYMPGLAVVALIAAVRRRSAAGIAIFAAAAALGFLALAGHHLLTLWRDFGNPVFPMLNNIFHSPWFEPESGTAGEFQARDVWQVLAYPFYWLKTNSYLVTERPFRDWRGAAAYLAIVAAIVIWLLWLRAGKAARRGPGDTRDLTAVIIFAVISYVAWALLFGNYRYAVTLEMLTGVIIIGVLTWMIRGRTPQIAGAVAVVALLAATTLYPDWGRGRFGERTIDVRVPPLPANSLVLMATGQPVAFFIPFAEPSARFIGIENDFLELSQQNLLVAKARSLMAARDRPTFIVGVGEPDPGGLNDVLAQFGLTLGAGPCRPIRSNLENPALRLCPAVPRE
jgi:hypothetical protein